MRNLFLLAAATAALAAQPHTAAAQSAAEPGQLEVTYSGYFLGIKLLETTMQGSFSDEAYDVVAQYRTGGPFSWVRQDRITVEVSGQSDGEELQPVAYRHTNVTKRKTRTIDMSFPANDVVATVTPPFGSLGDPPASQAERAGSLDLVSAILQLSLNINDDAARPCGGDLQVFDGKQRYDLRMVYAGAYQADIDAYTGAVLQCDVYYRPVSGFDPEDIPKDKYLNRPLRVWFTNTPERGGYVPVRFAYSAGLGTFVIEAKELSYDGAPLAQTTQHAAR